LKVDSTREKISEALKSRYEKVHYLIPFLGKHLFEEYENKISFSRAKLKVCKEDLEKFYWKDCFSLTGITKIYEATQYYTRMVHYNIA